MEDKRMILFMVIFSFLFVLAIWFFQPKKENQNISVDQTSDQEVTKNIEQETQVKKDFYGQYEIINQVQEKKYDLTYENNNIKIEFDPNDAILKHAWVKDSFLNKQKKDTLLYDLVDPVSNNGALLLKMGSWENEATLSNLTGGNNLYNVERVGNDFIFTCSLKKKNEDLIYFIQKVYKFIDNENLFKLDIKITNNKNLTTDFDNSGIAFSIGWGPSLGIDTRNKIQTNKALKNNFTYFNGNDLVKITNNGEEIKIPHQKGIKNLFTLWDREGNDSWVASDGHYFAAAMYPDNQKYKYFFDYRGKNKQIYYCGLSRSSNVSQVDSSFYIYLGPKISDVLKKYNDLSKYDKFLKDNSSKSEFNLKNFNITEIDELSKFNWNSIFGFGGLIRGALEKLFIVFKNYGLAIIILTLIIKIIIFPLTYSSMNSQQKMSKLQPKIKELQQKYKDKPDILNKETMNLYKKEKINPLGGCLPMLLQMPLLIAMYTVLNQMVALKGSDFLWVKDLSVPDSVINFGFTIPLVNITALNILPIIMIITQLLSSLMMPDLKTNKQAQIMVWGMPIFFFFIFYNVSSGLVLYWTIMNILNLVQQMIMNSIQKKKQTA